MLEAYSSLRALEAALATASTAVTFGGRVDAALHRKRSDDSLFYDVAERCTDFCLALKAMVDKLNKYLDVHAAFLWRHRHCTPKTLIRSCQMWLHTATFFPLMNWRNCDPQEMGNGCCIDQCALLCHGRKMVSACSGGGWHNLLSCPFWHRLLWQHLPHPRTAWTLSGCSAGWGCC